MPPTSGSSVKATARGFEVLLMPFDVSKGMAGNQTYILGDTLSDYGHKSIFLTLEVTGTEENHESKKSNLCITYPVTRNTIGRLKYEALHESVIYYKTGIGEKEPDLIWFMSSTLPKFEQRSKIHNSCWKDINVKIATGKDQRFNAVYLRSTRGRRVNPDFFTKCELGKLKCRNLLRSRAPGGGVDPEGRLKTVLLANKLLTRDDTDSLLEFLKTSYKKQENNKSLAQPTAEQVSEEPQGPEPLNHYTESCGEETQTTVPSIQVTTRAIDNEVFVPDTPGRESGTGATRQVAPEDSGSPAGSLFQSPPDLPPGAVSRVVGKWTISYWFEDGQADQNATSGNLIDFNQEFTGLGAFEKKSWVTILHDELLSTNMGSRHSASNSEGWLSILKREFEE